MMAMTTNSSISVKCFFMTILLVYGLRPKGNFLD